jgi:hypothetical protein
VSENLVRKTLHNFPQAVVSDVGFFRSNLTL